MAKHSSSAGSKLALLAFLLLTISAPTLGKMPPISETKELDDVVMKSVMQQVAKERLKLIIAPYYYYKQEMARKFGGLKDEYAIDEKLQCRTYGEGCGTPSDCCSGICNYLPSVHISVCT